MFGDYGSDLANAYAAPMYDPNPQMLAPPSMNSMNDPSPRGAGANPATASHAAQPEAPYTPPPAMYAQQGAAPPHYAGPSFWDRLVMKRSEVVKLVCLALIIVFAIGVDRVSTHYVAAYVAASFLTPLQEALVRISYPLVALLLLWFMKAAMAM